MTHLAENLENHQAEALILRDLIDAALSENLFGILDRVVVARQMAEARSVPDFALADDERYLRLPAGRNSLILRVRGSSAQPYRLSRLPVVLVSTAEAADPGRAVGAREVMHILAELLGEDDRRYWPNLDGFDRDLGDALAQTTLLLAAAPGIIADVTSGPRPSLEHWERLATLRDRPFHPTARAKSGWSASDYQQFGALPGVALGLDWIGVRRDLIQCSAAAQSISLPALLLDAVEQQALAASYAADVRAEDYVALPVHPWQMEQVLPALYADEFAQRQCVPLARGLGRFTATSSVRSLAPAGGGRTHIKLPLGISALGALRLLPPRYLHNGGRAQSLLEHVAATDHDLARQLWLCDERSWWAYSSSGGDPFADKPGHLACLLRRYPQDLLDDPAIELIPMSALTVVTPGAQVPAANHLLRTRSVHTTGRDDVLALFHEIAIRLIDVALRCFRFGLMPELHGQNVVLVARSGRIAGVLLRDHDTVRTCRPWMERAGLPEPGYVVKPGTPNSLINQTPEVLLVYFQTLAVQVNLAAIAQALAEGYAIDEHHFWSLIREAIAAALRDLPEPVRHVGERSLLDAAAWPTKLVLTPLLQRVGTGGGSMPSGIGSTRNPLTLTTTSGGSFAT